MRATLGLFVVALASTIVSGCGSTLPRTDAVRPAPPPLTENQKARRLLCADLGDDACLAACDDAASPREHGDCLLTLRFGEDPEALRLARGLYFEKNTLVGVETPRSIDSYKGRQVPILPALPVFHERHHLEWLVETFEAFESFVAEIGARSSEPVRFDPHPPAVKFFRTFFPTYPSAYFVDGVIGYNLDGPLHADRRQMHETMFHELFHLSDARRDTWSVRVLPPIYRSIRTRCGGSHTCFGKFAPHHSTVAKGTYYAFDERTGDEREYAAELALRYYLEHEAILEGRAPVAPPFKCVTPENGAAWDLLVAEFFGGVDLSAPCEDGS